jgi:hypothetical protein
MEMNKHWQLAKPLGWAGVARIQVQVAARPFSPGQCSDLEGGALHED